MTRRVYTTAKIGPDPSKNSSGPNNFCKQTVNFSRGHGRLLPHEKLTVSLQKLSVTDQFFEVSGSIFAVVYTRFRASVWVQSRAFLMKSSIFQIVAFISQIVLPRSVIGI